MRGSDPSRGIWDWLWFLWDGALPGGFCFSGVLGWALGYDSLGFRHSWYFLISKDPKCWVAGELVAQLVYTMFISNNRASFHLWWKENLVKHQKVSKYYENDCLQNFLLLFMSLLTAKFVKNSHILARIYFISLKNALKQTCNFFDTKFGIQWKDGRSSYQVR